MKIKIKSKPEDFIVEEIADLPFKRKGNFGVYLLEKKGWNTVGLLFELSKKLKIPFSNFSYGGKKDRHASTSQYISIKGKKINDLKKEEYSLKFCGFMDRCMGPDLIKGNKFEIVVRNLAKKEAQTAVEEMRLINSFGYPNYFDDQRFGSFDQNQGFMAQKLLKKHFNGALKIYLTAIYAADKKTEKERKRYFNENWKDWKACQKMAVTEFEKKAFAFLDKNPNGYLFLLKQLPREQLCLYRSAYQAHLWNEVARRLLKEKFDAPFKTYPGAVGDYIFHAKLNKQKQGFWEDLEIPTACAKVKMPDELITNIYEQVLRNEGLTSSMFNSLKIREVFFKSTARRMIVRPQHLTMNTFEDELDIKKQKLLLVFVLPRASYGTMLVKRLFSQPQ